MLKSLSETRRCARADAFRAQVTKRDEIKDTLENLIEYNTQTPDTRYTGARRRNKQAKYLAQSYPTDIGEEQFVQECQHFKKYMKKETIPIKEISSYI
ncbi:hypothetical protein TNCV_471 [Trichonephila clavipes]|nr:hypothetical protein TNCV_471 [Trichonephila clavipes]